jgi:hypothetical protein
MCVHMPVSVPIRVALCAPPGVSECVAYWAMQVFSDDATVTWWIQEF